MNMKKIKIIVAIVLAVAVIGGGIYGITAAADKIDFGEIVIDGIPEKADGTTRVMSFNVRCKSDPEGSIANRSQIVNAILTQYQPDSFGVQEANPKWLKILDEALGDKYARVGEGRGAIEIVSEYSAVYYLKDKYNLIDSGTIWLSETPEKKYTKSFDSSMNRIASWAVLEDKETGKTYTHINTHLDHVLESTRVGQAGVLLEKIEELQALGHTVVATGDFNSHETGEAYAKMREAMDDTKLTAKTSDTGITYHGYGSIDEHKDGAIDFVFATKGTEVETYKIIRNTAKDMYPSDHYPVVADVYIK